MKRNRGPAIIYYENELEDEFSKAKIIPKRIDGTYRYQGGRLRKAGRALWYHVIAKPLAFLYLKIKYNHKIVNKECLNKAKDTGFFLYGNHTNAIADALIPGILCNPTEAYVIVHPNNVSMPIWGNITPSLGAIPLPDDKEAVRNFNEMLKTVINNKHCIAIYPEAHIWPYYTGIRDFKDTSFRYPVHYGTPVFCFTNTYQKREGREIPQMVTYVEGPFYANQELPARAQRKHLHRQVMDSMKNASRLNNVELIQYVKKEKEM